eukprot:8565630-Pyramimonas_sp.AAC.1
MAISIVILADCLVSVNLRMIRRNGREHWVIEAAVIHVAHNALAARRATIRTDSGLVDTGWACHLTCRQHEPS